MMQRHVVLRYLFILFILFSFASSRCSYVFCYFLLFYTVFIINVRSFNSWELKVLCGAGAHNFVTVISFVFVSNDVSGQDEEYINLFSFPFIKLAHCCIACIVCCKIC
ncbi:hypothetical protein AMELA_G00005650 [Ameiurus melas]|uniref:Uncharacterized protein n=1 Tax=Ameiurus melas TaxID=219545 RepID=A0A7J6BI21_AMEME|nr:hypothetical protein AMELA_G00005650 [Ameiurus melas]